MLTSPDRPTDRLLAASAELDRRRAEAEPRPTTLKIVVPESLVRAHREWKEEGRRESEAAIAATTATEPTPAPSSPSSPPSTAAERRAAMCRFDSQPSRPWMGGIA